MNRYLVLILVVVFGLASVSGPTMAAGIASGDFWTVTGAEFCLEPVSIAETAPVFKPCSKKINGHAVSCQHLTAILPLPVTGVFQPRTEAFRRQDSVVVALSANDRHFRPPQAG